MEPIASIQTSQGLGSIGSQARGHPQDLAQQAQAGQLFKATVVEAGADNSFVLQLGDELLSARSELQLKPGQTLQLQLVSTSPQFEFRVVHDTLNQLLGKSLSLIDQPIDITSLFETLQLPPALLDKLSPQSQQTLQSYFALQQDTLAAQDSGNVLKQLIDRLGLTQEHLLARGQSDKAAATLKTALLEVLHTLKSSDQLSQNASHLLATLELFQVAQLHFQINQQFIFPLPLPFLKQGYLVIDQKGEERGGQGEEIVQERRFALHLQLSDIGNLRIEFILARKGLFIRFHADSEAKAAFIADRSDELKQTITATPLLGLSFAADAKDPATELLRRIIPEGKSVLDTTA